MSSRHPQPALRSSPAARPGRAGRWRRRRRWAAARPAASAICSPALPAGGDGQARGRRRRAGSAGARSAQRRGEPRRAGRRPAGSMIGPPTKAIRRWPCSTQVRRRRAGRRARRRPRPSSGCAGRSRGRPAPPGCRARSAGPAAASRPSSTGVMSTPGTRCSSSRSRWRRSRAGVLAAVADDDHQPPCSSAAASAPRTTSVKNGLATSSTTMRDRAAAPGAQLAGRVVADVAELGDRVEDPLAGGRGHHVGPVEHVAHRAEETPARAGDLLDARSCHGSSTLVARPTSGVATRPAETCQPSTGPALQRAQDTVTARNVDRHTLTEPSTVDL